MLLPLRVLGPQAMSWGLTSLRSSMSITRRLGGLSGRLMRRGLGGGVVWSRWSNTQSMLDELVLLERSHGWEQPGLYGPPPCSKSESYRLVLNSILFVESLLPWCPHDEGAGAGRRYGRAWRGADAVEGGCQCRLTRSARWDPVKPGGRWTFFDGVEKR